MGRAGHLWIEGDRACVPQAAFGHAGFRAWTLSADYPSDVRGAYVGGEVLIEMSPEELEAHAKVKLALTATLARLVQEDDLGELYPHGALLTNERAALSCEPDLLFVSWASLAKNRVRLVPKAGRADRFVELVGTPDLVVEIVSDSSERKDTTLLREGYRRAGVAEYWLIDARGELMRFEILKLGRSRYTPSAPAGRAQSSLVLGCSVSLRRARNRVGRFTYNLRADPLSAAARI